MRWRCRACGGEFDDVTADGAPYFHACPPLGDGEIARALGLPGDADTWTRAQRQAVRDAARARANARDENIDPIKAEAALDDSGARRRGLAADALVKAPGDGRLSI